MNHNLLDQLLAAPSDAARSELLTAHADELEALAPGWYQAAWDAGLAGDPARALGINTILLGIMRAIGNRDALALALQVRGNLLNMAGQPAEACRCWEEALTCYEQPPANVAGRAQAALSLGTSYWGAGDLAAALPRLQAAVADFDSLPPNPSAGFAHVRLGDTLRGLQQWDAALAHYARARELFAGLGQEAFVADRWIDAGVTLKEAGRPAAAAESLETAVTMAETLGDPGRLCRALLELGYVRGIGLAEYEAALAVSRRAVEIAQGPDLVDAHVQAAGMCELLARWDEAAGHYRRAAEACAGLADPLREATCLEGLAGTYKRQGDYAGARDAYLQALAVYAGRSDLAGAAVRLHGELGQLAWEWGRPEEALQHYREALSLAEATADWLRAGFIAGTMAALYEFALGLPDEARGHYQQAAAYYQRADTPEARWRGHRQLGDLALADGDIGEAIDQYGQAVKAARRASDRLALADVHRALAQAHAAHKDYAAAVRDQRRALRLYRQLDVPQQLAQGYVDLASLHADCGQRDRAIRAQRSAVRLYRTLGDRAGAALTEVGLALIYFAAGRYAAARRVLKRALTTVNAGDFEEFNTIHTAYVGLGAVHERLGRPAEALRSYRQAIALAERHQATLILPAFKMAFLGGRENLYARAALLAAQNGHAAEAFGHIESGRSRAFLQILGLATLPLAPGRVPPELLAQETRWLARLRELLARQSPDAFTPAQWAEIRAVAEQLTATWAAIGDEEYTALRQGRPVTLAEIKECLVGCTIRPPSTDERGSHAEGASDTERYKFESKSLISRRTAAGRAFPSAHRT